MSLLCVFLFEKHVPGSGDAGADTIACPQRSAKDAPEVAEKLAKDFSIKCKAYQCDVGKADLVAQTFEKINSEMGPIHGWGLPSCEYHLTHY